jgi:hypothetical protein
LNKGGRLGIAHSLVSSKYIFAKFKLFVILGRMTFNTKLDEKLEGADNFQAWKYRVILILEENYLEGFIEE